MAYKPFLDYRPENINFIGNVLKSKGYNENAILGALVNMGAESGWSPFSDEKVGAPFYPPQDWIYGGRNHGYGLVQYSYKPIAQMLYDYAHQNHTMEENIIYQLSALDNEFGYNINNGATWQPVSSPVKVNSIQDYWKNTKGLDAKTCAMVWFSHFEKAGGYQTGATRYDKYINLVNSKWDRSGNVPGGVTPPSGGGGEEKPKPDKKPPKKVLSLQDCISFLDKAVTRPSKPPAPTPGPDKPPNPPSPAPSGDVGSIIWQNYQLFVSHHCYYSTQGYGIRYRFSGDPWICDCSTFVMSCVNLILGGDFSSFSKAPAWATGGMIAGLGGIGWHLIREGIYLDGDFKAGDIIVMGTGSGAKAHTIICYDDNGNFVEVTGGDGYYTYAMRNRPYTWHRQWNLPYFNKNFLFRMNGK